MSLISSILHRLLTAKVFQIEVEDSACVIGLWLGIPTVFALDRLN
jgi:hypothetical protein